MNSPKVTPTKFHSLQIPQSPVAASPNRNLTGSARVVRDAVADLYNTIQKWNDSHIRGAQLVKQIALVKADDISEYSSELEEYLNSLYLQVQLFKSYVDLFYILQNRISALCKIEKKAEPLFISFTVEDLFDSIKFVCDGYIQEFEVKEMVVENVAHSKNKDEVMFFAACWMHQPNISREVILKLEALLLETGHRKFY